ncbi:amidohydrolase family protein [Sphingomonas sp. MMS24-JH45]
MINYARGNLDDVHGMMTGPHALYGLSDGGAHCGTICDGSSTTTIALWSNSSKSGLSTPLERLVHGYTQRNAAHVGWHDRGVLAPGYLADLNVIALDRFARAARDRAGPARRRHTPSATAAWIPLDHQNRRTDLQPRPMDRSRAGSPAERAARASGLVGKRTNFDRTLSMNGHDRKDPGPDVRAHHFTIRNETFVRQPVDLEHSKRHGTAWQRKHSLKPSSSLK